MKQGKEKVLQNVILSAVLTALLFILINFAGGMLSGQPQVFMYSDMYGQYVHIINLFVRTLFSGQSPDYSFNMGLGMPMEAAFSGSCLSPFNLLFLIIQDPDTASLIVTVVKLSVAAGAFTFLTAETLKTDSAESIVFSAIYALCGYSVNFSFGIIFLDGLYILPILVWCLRKFILEGKWKLLCIIYAYSFIVQMYTGYIVGIFSAVIFTVMIVARNGSEWKKTLRTTLYYAGCVLIAFLISAAVILPEMIGIMRNSQADSDAFEGLKSGFFDLLAAFFLGNNSPVNSDFPAVYSGLIVFLILPLFFRLKNIERKHKAGVAVILLFLLICSLWGPAYLFMHGFNTPDGFPCRFSYFWSFIAAYVSLWVYIRIRDSREYRKYFLLSGVIAGLLYGALNYARGHVSGNTGAPFSVFLWMVNFFFLFLYGYLLGKKSESRAVRGILCAVLSVELFANGFFTVSEKTDGGITRSRAYYELWKEQAEGAKEMISQNETGNPNTFYRVCYQNAPTENISMLYGYRGLGYFASIENVNLRDTLTRLGYASSPRFLLEYGSTPVMRMLLGQKYYVQAGDPRGEHPEYYAVSELPETLGLGYMVSENVIDYNVMESNDPFENQERLLSSMCGEEIDVYEPINDPLSVTQDGIKVELKEEGILLTREREEESYADYSIYTDSDLPAYAYFSFWGMAVQDLSSPIVQSGADLGCAFTMPFLTMPHIMPLVRGESGDYRVRITMKPGGMVSVPYEDQWFVCYNEKAKSDAYQSLKEHEMTIDRFGNTDISAHVDVPEDRKLLFTTIPYDENWHVSVDGTEGTIVPVLNDSFAAVQMKAGVHEVVFKYHNPWKDRGICLTAIGFMVMLFVSIITNAKNRVSKGNPEQAE